MSETSHTATQLNWPAGFDRLKIFFKSQPLKHFVYVCVCVANIYAFQMMITSLGHTIFLSGIDLLARCSNGALATLSFMVVDRSLSPFFETFSFFFD